MNHPQAAKGHMPFEGHRTQEEVREDEELNAFGAQVWCPEEYRAAFIELRRKGAKPLYARQLIENQIEVDERRSARA